MFFNRNGKKLTISRKMSQITNNSRKSYHPDWDPPKTGDDLEVQGFLFFIVQIHILFFSRVTLAICIQLSFTGFISFWFMYAGD